MSKYSVAHVEIPATDPKTSSKFYSEIFGWKIEVEPNFDYHMFQPESGPSGGFTKLSDGAKPGEMPVKPGDVLVYFYTDDIEGTLARAASLGGKALMPKTEIPNMGWFAFFADPTGNRIGLWTSMHPEQERAS